MSIYRRYFRVKTGPLIKEIKRIEKVNDAAHQQYLEIIEEIGAKPGYFQRHLQLVALVFETDPDPKKYKRVENGWMPRRTGKANRLLSDRIASIVTIPENEALKVLGLSEFALMGNGRIYCNTLTVVPKKQPVAYVGVPWRDIDPKELEAYQKDDNTYDGDMDHLGWQPPAEFVAMKEWEVKRDFDKWNSRVKEIA